VALSSSKFILFGSVVISQLSGPYLLLSSLDQPLNLLLSHFVFLEALPMYFFGSIMDFLFFLVNSFDAYRLVILVWWW
jgi:hypothetical protein